MGNSKIELILVYCFFCFLCWSFYQNDQSVSVSQLSTDQWNILPVVMKYNNTNLFSHDLFASEIEDLEYYTPWFVKPLLFFSFLNDFDFLKGLNSFHLVIQLIYCFLWLFLFQKITGNIWLSALMVMIVRGVLWPPGNELWGIASVWTLLPRTVYSAFIPLPILLIFKVLKKKEFDSSTNMFLAFITGLIGNFHPVSGLVFGVCILISHYVLIFAAFKLKNITAVFIGFGMIVFFLLGLSPFIYTYITEILVTKPSNPALFKEYLPLRIGNQFLEPFSIFNKLFSLKWLVFLFFPVVTTTYIFKYFDKKLHKIIYFILLLFFMVLLVNLLIIPLETFLNNIVFNNNLKVAFQLVRNIKYLIVPTYLLFAILISFLLKVVYDVYGVRWYNSLSILLFVSFLCFCFLSRSYEFDLPLLSDDILRSSLPDNLTPLPYVPNKNVDLDEAIKWISKNTPVNSSFIGPTALRPGAQRSLVFDFKGASMLIEGNPDKFVKWAQMKIELDNTTESKDLIFLFKKWDVDYWLTKERVNDNIKIIKEFKVWTLYKIQ